MGCIIKAPDGLTVMVLTINFVEMVGEKARYPFEKRLKNYNLLLQLLTSTIMSSIGISLSTS